MTKLVEIKTCDPGPAPPENPRTIEMGFGSVKDARETLERLAESFASGKISESQSRTLVYIYNGILSYFKLEAETEIEARLDAIEAQLNNPPRRVMK